MKSFFKISALFIFTLVFTQNLQANLLTNEWVFIESKLNRLHLDVKMGNTAAKTPVWMYSQNGSTAQQWKLENAGDGYYYIKSRRSGLYLDVQGGSKQAKAVIWQYPLNRTDAQKWKPVPAGDGYYYLRAKISGLYLDVQGGRTQVKTPVWQYPLNRTDAQKWKLKRVAGNSADATSGNNNGNSNIPGRYNLPEKFRPAFANMPVWRLQLRVTTSGNDKANTDDKVYVQLTNAASSKYFLDRAGDDREKNKVNTYDILDPNIRTMKDIQMLKLVILGNDGWCVQKVELLVNDVNTAVFKKSYRSCQWLDGDSGAGPSLLISGSELRRYAGWRHQAGNKAIWLPPTVIKRATLEEIVESYIGHMMDAQPSMRKLKFGKKYGRAYVEATRVSGNKLHFDLDLAYDSAVDLETDVDFDLVVQCQNNQLNLEAQAIRGELNVPIISSIVRIFKSDFAKMKMCHVNFAGTAVAFCPNIRVESNGDISIRP